DLATGRALWVREEKPDGVRAIAMTLDGSRIATCGGGDQIRVYDTSSGALRPAAPIQGTGAIAALAFLPGTKTLLGGGDDASVRVVDIDIGLASDIFRIPDGQAITCLAAAPDGVRFVSGGADQLLRYRDSANKELRRL